MYGDTTLLAVIP